MTAMKQAAQRVLKSRSSNHRYQTTCRPDEFWTRVWRMWWRQTGRQAEAATFMRDASEIRRPVRSRVDYSDRLLGGMTSWRSNINHGTFCFVLQLLKDSNPDNKTRTNTAFQSYKGTFQVIYHTIIFWLNTSGDRQADGQSNTPPPFLRCLLA